MKELINGNKHVILVLFFQFTKLEGNNTCDTYLFTLSYQDNKKCYNILDQSLDILQDFGCNHSTHQ